MARIVVVGSINADLSVRVERHPAPGETVMGSGVTVSPGGKGANQAVAAARLGADVAMVGAVGSDEYAESALRWLGTCGIDMSGVARVGGALAAKLADGADLIEAARFASQVGAYAATGRGAQDSYPDADSELPPLA